RCVLCGGPDDTTSRTSYLLHAHSEALAAFQAHRFLSSTMYKSRKNRPSSREDSRLCSTREAAGSPGSDVGLFANSTPLLPDIPRLRATSASSSRLVGGRTRIATLPGTTSATGRPALPSKALTTTTRIPWAERYCARAVGRRAPISTEG